MLVHIKQRLHFLHLNVNSILSRLDELKTTAGSTKASIIGMTV